LSTIFHRERTREAGGYAKDATYWQKGRDLDAQVGGEYAHLVLGERSMGENRKMSQKSSRPRNGHFVCRGGKKQG